MFHIINQVEGVYEIWWQEDADDYLWTWITECDTLEEARNEIDLLERSGSGESYISHD